MTRKSIKSFFVAIIMALFCLLSPIGQTDVYANNCKGLNFILLSSYSKTMNIQAQYQLGVFNLTGKKPTFKSTNSGVASVSSTGLITAKKSGFCKISVKAGGASADCSITVVSTKLTLSHYNVSMEIGRSLQLIGKSNPQHTISWKSNNPSVASVDEYGLVTAKKAGNATITASVDGTVRNCKVTVNKPIIRLSHSSIKIYRTQRIRLIAKVSSGKKPSFKSNRPTVATIDSDGLITAVKNGSTIITVSVDGVSKNCIVIVEQPTIKITPSEVTLKAGKSMLLHAKVSSGVKPKWSSSNINVVSVDENGYITARQPGKCYIYAKEDGVKASCIVTVTK